MPRAIRLGHAPNCSSLGNVLTFLVWSQAALAALWVASESWPVKRRRREPDGSETKLVEEPPAIVTEGEREGPIEAHVQVTRDCALPCVSCHVEPSPGGPHVPLATLDERFADLAARGVLRVALGGGESLRHPELPEIVAAARRHGLAVGLTTSGVGPRRALAGFDQVNISLDGVGDSFRASRGYDAELALAAIRRHVAEGLRVGVNIVLDRRTFPELGDTVAAAVSAGARDVQLLRLKPVGRAAADYLDRRLTPEQVLALWPAVQELMAENPGVTFRVDCSMVPMLAAHGVDPARMRQLDFLGCHGGDAMLSVDVDGAEHACSFVSDAPGRADWRAGVTAAPCAGCAWRDICRGGCHAVARHLTGDTFAPDPECPIVVGGVDFGGPKVDQPEVQA